MYNYCFNLTINYKDLKTGHVVNVPVEIRTAKEGDAWTRAREMMRMMVITLENMHLKCNVVSETIELVGANL
jgi:hypothetical protein